MVVFKIIRTREVVHQETKVEIHCGLKGGIKMGKGKAEYNYDAFVFHLLCKELGRWLVF